MQKFIEKLELLGSPQVVLIGDYMLDSWVYGDVERLSQEAPVPVLRVARTEERTGAAGNVAAAIVALGGEVSCIGVTGDDSYGGKLSKLLKDAGATASLLRIAGRPTTLKTRYVGLAQHKNAQQILRVDNEVTDDIPPRSRQVLLDLLDKECAGGDPILAIQDHNKGVLNDANTPEIIARAISSGLKVIVDPALIPNYERYKGATLLTPNRYEASLASGVKITDEKSLALAGQTILDRTRAEALMITLDKEGIFLMASGQCCRRLPPKPRAVYDGTGAGDAVLASVAVALGQGWDYKEAADLANIVGGLEVERFGVVAVTKQEVMDELRRIIGLRGGKTLRRIPLAEELMRRRQQGETIVFTNGCFDLLHMGHVRYLRQARELGSCLVVAINSDDSVKRLKGLDRPVIAQDERGEMLGALECVDYVTVFDEDTPIPLLELIKPDILVKGGTTAEVVGREVVENYGGKVMKLDLVKGLSTTEIIDRIVGRNDKSKGMD